MEVFVSMLDKNLRYINHEIIENELYIYVESKRDEVKCPYCGEGTTKEHSRYERSFQDLPVQGKKTVIVLINRKMFCNNPDCPHKTFGERFDFLEYKAKKTKRLKDEIIKVALRQSSVSASSYLSDSIAKVRKSTICNYLKKIRNSD